MKDQYFGDKRDFFKYHLALTLVERLNLDHFTLVAMLTPPDGGNDGNLLNTKVRNLRPELYDFLLSSASSETTRTVASLRTYMALHHPTVQYLGYEDADTEPMTLVERHDYFKRLPSSALQRAVILIDPDNGFPPPLPTAMTPSAMSRRRREAHKHLRFDELAQVFDSMTEDSVLVAFQYWPREKRAAAFERIAQGIVAAVPTARPLCASDNDIGFFIVTKTDEMHERVQSALGGFALNKPCIFYGVENESLLATSPHE